MNTKELQIQLMAIAQVLEGVETKGFENMNRLLSAIRELRNLASKLPEDQVEVLVEEIPMQKGDA